MKIHSTLSAFMATSLAMMASTAYAKNDTSDKKPLEGRILLLETCPGDVFFEEKTDGGESLILAILTPLISFAVNKGLQSLGKKFTADAKEANIDTVQQGSHFFRAQNLNTKTSFYMNHTCFIAFSKSHGTSKRSLENFAPEYKWRKTILTTDGKTKVSWVDGLETLRDELRKHGVTDGKLPAILGVFEVGLSAEQTEFRLIPRYVYSDHSYREKRVDSKSRTFSFEFDISQPGEKGGIAKTLLKFDNIVSGVPYTQYLDPSNSDIPQNTTKWISMPALSDQKKLKIAGYKTAKTEYKTSLETIKTVGKIAFSIQTSKDIWITGIKGSMIKPEGVSDFIPCPSKNNTLKGLRAIRTTLAIEESKADKNALLITQLTNAKTYYDTCITAIKLRATRDTLKIHDGELAGAYDVKVIFKEFRKRPFVQFIGEALSDEATRKALTSSIADRIDPATRAAARKEQETAIATANLEYETALSEAAIATIAYNGAKAAAANSATIELQTAEANAYSTMMAKQRSANRAAKKLGITAPYPDAGLWFF